MTSMQQKNKTNGPMVFRKEISMKKRFLIKVLCASLMLGTSVTAVPITIPQIAHAQTSVTIKSEDDYFKLIEDNVKQVFCEYRQTSSKGRGKYELFYFFKDGTALKMSTDESMTLTDNSGTVYNIIDMVTHYDADKEYTCVLCLENSLYKELYAYASANNIDKEPEIFGKASREELPNSSLTTHEVMMKYYESAGATGYIGGKVYNQIYSCDNMYFYYDADTKKVIVDGRKCSGNVVVPSAVTIPGAGKKKVTVLNGSSFVGNNKITSVTLPDTITKIEDGAFRDCEKLKSVTIRSKKLKKIPAKCFENCNKLKTIKLYTTKLKSVDKSAMTGVKKITVQAPKDKLKAYKKLFKKAVKNVSTKAL